MRKFILTASAGLLGAAMVLSQNVVVKSPGYFTDPIRDGYALFPDSLVFPQDAEEIHIPNVGMFGRVGEYNFPKLKRLTVGNVDYLPGWFVAQMPQLEEIVFEGMIGHFDCEFLAACPKLKKVVFKGPVSSTGGPLVVARMPELDSVIFESVVVDLGVMHDSIDECPKLKELTCRGAFLNVPKESASKKATIAELKGNPRLIKDMERLARWQAEVLTARNSGFMRSSEYQSARILQPVLEELKSPEAPKLKAAMEYAWNLGDDVKSELEVLKEAPAYVAEPIFNLPFEYATPDDSVLAAARERFNLDSIAGNGDDISRIKNLLYWVHDNIKHDGSNGLAPGKRTLENTYDGERRDSCGYNCRALAISLAEALLAEGIPARYIGCIPKKWDTDNDSHVICVAWSDKLGKWVWVDPTHAAWVTDENGLMLHPGEVRERLRKDLPLFINADANYNHLYTTDKDYYLDYYMAKNLYFMQANTFNQGEAEGPSSRRQGSFVTLIPPGAKYPYTHYTTTDEEWFWQPPVKASK